MKPTAGLLGALVLASALAVAPAAWACGYHDPSSVNRGILNWVYTNALYVGTAVWMAQRDGVIPRDEGPAAVKALFGYQKTVARLATFRDRLSGALDVRTVPAFSIVLLGPMLWTRFEPTGTVLTMTSHADGPSNGDVVIVTDEPVVAALVDGRVTPQAAREMGLMRLYGAPDRIEDVTSWLDHLPLQSSKEQVDAAQYASR